MGLAPRAGGIAGIPAHPPLPCRLRGISPSVGHQLRRLDLADAPHLDIFSGTSLYAHCHFLFLLFDFLAALFLARRFLWSFRRAAEGRLMLFCCSGSCKNSLAKSSMLGGGCAIKD
jgi:hypothetical protein